MDPLNSPFGTRVPPPDRDEPEPEPEPEPGPAEHMYINPAVPAADGPQAWAGDAHAFSLSKNVYRQRGSGFFGYEGEYIELIVYQMADGSRSLKLGEAGENIEFSKMTVGFPKGNKAWGGGYGSWGEHIPKHQTLQLILYTDQGKKKYNVAFANPHDINDFLMKAKKLNDEDPKIFTVRKGVIGGNADTRVNDVDKLSEIILRSQQYVSPPAKGGGRKKNKSKKKSKKRRKSKSKKRRKSKSKKRRKSKSK